MRSDSSNWTCDLVSRYVLAELDPSYEAFVTETFEPAMIQAVERADG